MSSLVQRLRTAPEQFIITILFIGLGAYLGMQVLFSMQWRMVHDAPLIHYTAFLIDRFGYVPYVDIFTNTFPGTLAFHLLIGKTLGYGDGAFRAVDLVWTGALLLATWLIMAGFGRRVAWMSALLFGLSYLQHGQMMSFQRDYIGILPVALAVLVVRRARPVKGLHALIVGFCFGLAIMIKPHLGLGLPIVSLALVWEMISEYGPRTWPQALIKVAIGSAVGLVIPLLGVFAWVWQMGAWQAYSEMVSQYLPLYLGMTGDHVTIAGFDRWLYLLRSYGQFGGLGLWLAAAVLGIYLSLFIAKLGKAQQRQVILLVSLALIYSIYVVFGGKFWEYHWMPFQYFVTLLASLLVIAQPKTQTTLGQRLVPLGVLVLVSLVTLFPTNDFLSQLFGHAPRQPNDGRVDEIAAYLDTRLQPGETVQQLDWTGGATQAMLQAGAPMATPYMEDYVFYHHISDPYIQTQRKRFISNMRAAPPRFVIAVSDTPRPTGEDTSATFPDLEDLLTNEYDPVQTGRGYVIYEHRS